MEVESECVKVWQEERGRHRCGIENVCVRVWEGDKGRHRGGDRKCVCDSVGGRERNTYKGGRE